MGRGASWATVHTGHYVLRVKKVARVPAQIKLVGKMDINQANHTNKYCCHSVAQSRLSLCGLMDCSTPGFPVLHYPQSLLKLMSIESVMPSNQLILCRPLLLLPSVFPSIRVFSNESAP